MATASFLDQKQTDWALEHLKKETLSEFGESVSAWLETHLLNRLSSCPGWIEAQPIALGSWARGELSSKSDIDLLFCGPEAAVAEFMKAVQGQGLKVRARIPEDRNDWTVGVGPFDIIALLKAKAFSSQAQELLESQQKKILKRTSEWKRNLLREMHQERRERARRHDSITHYLEPNLKYGQGGLRDLEQALVVFDLFPDRFSGQSRVRELLLENRDFLLLIRQALHLLGGSEVLSATDQIEIAGRLGFKDVRLFARKVHLALDRVSFFSDWSLEQVRTSRKKREAYRADELSSVTELMEELKKDPSLSQQWKIRSQIDKVWKKEEPDSKQIGKWLLKYLNLDHSEAFLKALFRSRVLEKWVKDLARVKGLVQHDHYHRYTLDTHIQQCLVMLHRLHKKSRALGGLQFLVKDFAAEDWRILTLAALYHDLGKGLGGDHSSKGVELVNQDFKKFGFSDKLAQEVSWLVENHLILSTAAFRRNPQDPSTWRWLTERGVRGVCLRRLALWTVVDIQATNPEAWTPWKARLLEDLVKALESEGADRFRRILDMTKSKKLKMDQSILEEVDLATLQNLPLNVLIQDLEQVFRSSQDAPVLVKRLSPHRTWVRFHRVQDRKGLFLQFVKSLYASGCTILQSSVGTLPSVGVYDWFLVKTRRTPAQLKKTLSMMSEITPSSYSEIKFDQIQLVQESSSERVFSFRGQDRRGMLMGAAQALFDEDLEITWAKVHTWGRQVDDVFGVRGEGDSAEILRRLRDKWQENPRSEFEL